MSKLMFIPKWLKDDLLPDQYAMFEKDISSIIVSSADVINYHKAQWQFLKFLTGGEYSRDDLYSMYQITFVHQMPDNVELSVFLNKDESNVIVWDTMAAGTGEKDRMRFHCQANRLGTALYVIGENLDCQSSDAISACPQDLVCALLKLQHNSLRIEGRGTDKSSVFRESPLLTQLYVSYKSI